MPFTEEETKENSRKSSAKHRKKEKDRVENDRKELAAFKEKEAKRRERERLKKQRQRARKRASDMQNMKNENPSTHSIAPSTNALAIQLTPQMQFLQQEFDKQRAHEMQEHDKQRSHKIDFAVDFAERFFASADKDNALVVTSGTERIQLMVQAIGDSASDAPLALQDESSFETTSATAAVAADVSNAPVNAPMSVSKASREKTGGTLALSLMAEGLRGSGGGGRVASGGDAVSAFAFVSNSATKSTPAPAVAPGVSGANMASNSTFTKTKGELAGTIGSYANTTTEKSEPVVFGAAEPAAATETETEKETEKESINDMKAAGSSIKFATFNFGGHMSSCPGPKSPIFAFDDPETTANIFTFGTGWHEPPKPIAETPTFTSNVTASASTTGVSKKRRLDIDGPPTKRMK